MPAISLEYIGYLSIPTNVDDSHTSFTLHYTHLRWNRFIFVVLVVRNTSRQITFTGYLQATTNYKFLPSLELALPSQKSQDSSQLWQGDKRKAYRKAISWGLLLTRNWAYRSRYEIGGPGHTMHLAHDILHRNANDRNSLRSTSIKQSLNCRIIAFDWILWNSMLWEISSVTMPVSLHPNVLTPYPMVTL